MSEKRFTLMENISAYDGRVISEYVFDNEKRLTFEEVVDLLNQLVDENEQLRNFIKANVFGEYREGSLADLQFKAIAYDDLVNVEMDYDAEPKLIIYCKEGTKSDIERYARVKTFSLFIPLGVDYIIKEEE